MRHPHSVVVGSLAVLGAAAPMAAGQCPFRLEAASPVAVGAAPVAVAAADFDGDGRPDLAVANSGENTISILRGVGGENVYFQPAVNYAVGASPVFVLVGDFNADGGADLAVANMGDGSVSILLNAGGGAFHAAVSVPVSEDIRALASADLDGDGRLDLAVPNYRFGNGTVSILLGNGDGTFQPQVRYAVNGAHPHGISVGDLNGDGKPDLAMPNQSNTIAVLLGNGDGSFASASSTSIGGFPSAPTLRDFDGDSRLDMAISFGSTLSVRLGNGDGTFQSPTSYPVGNGATGVASGDLNGDGRPDLVLGNFGSNRVAVLLGNPGGEFQQAVGYAVGASPSAVALVDFSGDDRIDVVAANPNSNNISVILNTLTDPAVSQQPAPVLTCPAGAASFSVTATGTGPFTYRWQREVAPGEFVNLSNGRTAWDSCGGTAIVFGSTTRSLVIAADTAGGRSLCAGHAVRYRCIVTNACGSVPSQPATLTICAADFNCDGFLDFFDYDAFVTTFETGGTLEADFNGDDFVDFFDYDEFVAAFEAGC